MKIIQKGKWGNSDVYLDENGENLFVVKTFKNHHAFIKNTIGRFLISREYKALKKLSYCFGTADNINRRGKFSLSYRYIKGENLSSFLRHKNKISKDFFVKLEKAVKEMHSCGIVHLDLRTGSNIIVSEKKDPLIIDFQSYINLNLIPGKMLKKCLKVIDISGVYKHWKKISPETMSRLQKDRLASVNKKRNFWLLKGYMLQKFMKHKH